MSPYWKSECATIWHGDANQWLKEIPDASCAACVTSSDYWQTLNHHEAAGQVGLHETPEAYLEVLVEIFSQIRRILKPGGCLFQVMADTKNNYSPIKPIGFTPFFGESNRRRLVKGWAQKEPLNLPARLVDALRADGWYHRENMIWDKIRGGGSPVKGDGATSGHESILYFFKSNQTRGYANCTGFSSTIFRYGPSIDPMKVHPCPFPPELARDLILAASKPGEVIVDPFGGSGTTAGVALALGRKVITGDLVQSYCDRIVVEVEEAPLTKKRLGCANTEVGCRII
jgi:site-specific DNA-methyltransferase (cytosine-N4-specific)